MEGHEEQDSLPLWIVLVTAGVIATLAGIGVLTVLDWVGLLELSGLG